MLFNTRQAMKFTALVHEFWYRVTGGLIGGNVLGARTLLLTTTGRRSGKRYTTPLTYLEDGDTLIVIASNGGADTDPDWWRNLKANPLATVQVGAQRQELHAEAAAGTERDRLWSVVTTRYPVYRRYAGATKREIPVVVLRPEPARGVAVPEQQDAPPRVAVATEAAPTVPVGSRGAADAGVGGADEQADSGRPGASG